MLLSLHTHTIGIFGDAYNKRKHICFREMILILLKLEPNMINLLFQIWKPYIFCIQEADLAIAGISITSQRTTAVDFTQPYYIEPLAVALKVTTNKWLYFVKPLHIYVYMALALTPLLISLVILSLESWLSMLIPNSCEASLSGTLDMLFKLMQKIITPGESSFVNI